MGLTEATNVRSATRTSSPGPTSRTRSARWMAAVPLEQATAWRAPTASANSRSNRSTNGPTDETKFVARHSSRYAAALPPMDGSASGIRRSGLDTIRVAGRGLGAQPVDGRAEPVLQAGLAPASPAAPRARDGSACRHHDLARIGSQARRVLDDPRLHAEDPAREREQLADRLAPARCRAG